jgi:hypothetical protein
VADVGLVHPAGAAAPELSPATRTAGEVGMRQVDRLTEEMHAVREQITMLSRRQPACRALRAVHYGVGPLTSVAIWAEMGDCRPPAFVSEICGRDPKMIKRWPCHVMATRLHEATTPRIKR